MITRRFFTSLLTSLGIGLMIKPKPVHVASLPLPFVCLKCCPERIPQLDFANQNQYAIALGDAGRVKSVRVNGQDLTLKCMACEVGENGWAVVLPQWKTFCPCGSEIVKEIVTGNVEVELGPNYRQRRVTHNV